MTPEFWTLLGVIILQLASVYNNYRTNKTNAPLTNAQAESAMGDALDKLAQAYSKALDTIAAQDKELNELRPLPLKIAMQEQAIKQAQDDKTDWSAYAKRLIGQLEEREILPLPFRGLPPNGDSQKTKAVTQAEIDAAAKERKP
jgi:hypothetical protein